MTAVQTTDKLTTREAIAAVLAGSRKPMTVTQIADAAIPMTALKGATPKQTVYSILYGENKKPDGAFVRVNKGTFKLRPARRRAKAA